MPIFVNVYVIGPNVVATRLGMSHTTRGGFYAVRAGRYGPQICSTLEEFRAATVNYSGYSAKKFVDLHDAKAWLDEVQGSQLTETGRNHDMIIDSAETILGMPSPNHPRPRYSYPISATEWTEYTSPLSKPRANFYIDSTGDRLQPTGKGVSEARINSASGSFDRKGGSVSSTAQATSGSIDVPSNDITLSPEQKHVLDLVRAGKNVFFTGPAGTGKSVLLREIIHLLRHRLPQSVAITASTGIAGLNIGGSTVHSFAGIGLGKESAHVLACRISKSKFPRKRWLATSTLIIDEISMLDGTLFDKLEYIARYVRESQEPFGGMQLVLSGDFFQLPPVPGQNNGVPMPATYAFDAEMWQVCVGTPIVLSRIFRQKDNEFVKMLSAMRLGRLNSKTIAKFNQLSRPLVYDDGIEASLLFPLRAEVEGCNNRRLNELTGEIHTYHAMDSRGYNAKGNLIDKEMAQRLLDRLVAPREISLKVGAQVMLIKNIVQGILVNGSIGKVAQILTTSEALKRNIAIATLDRKGGKNDDTEVVATPPKSLISLNGHVFRKDEFWPLVHFTNGMELLCAPVEFSVEGLVGNVEAYRLQVPLILAWALSIHKSQGQTLSRVKVDLDRIFEKGQAYVALSRATNMETLEVINFQPSKVMAHPRVLAWQETWMPSRESEFDRSSDTEGEDVEMDCEEAIERSHSSWDLSQWVRVLPA